MRRVALVAMMAFACGDVSAENIDKFGEGSTRVEACSVGYKRAQVLAEIIIRGASRDPDSHRLAYGKPDCDCEEDTSHAVNSVYRWQCYVNVEVRLVAK